MSSFSSPSDIACENCGTIPLKAPRLICLECSVGDATYNLCANCLEASLEQYKGPKLHDPSHTLLQVRNPLSGRDASAVTRDWVSIVKTNPIPGRELQMLDREGGELHDNSVAAIHCDSCANVVARPCWFCNRCKPASVRGTKFEKKTHGVDISGHLFLCTACNTQVNETRPWLSERGVNVHR